MIPITVHLKAQTDNLQYKMKQESEINANIIGPYYEGEYEVTPDEYTQLLYTSGLRMRRNVMINPSSAGGGLTESVKQALLDCFQNVAWANENGMDYYNALEGALYPPADLVSISAVYTQGGIVYDNEELNDLREDLVVTAVYADESSRAVEDYTLSGELTEGTSTITVSYGGKTTTFDVTVTHATVQYTITNTLTECTNSNNASVINEMTEYTGTLTANQGYIMSSVTITMGNADITSTAYTSATGAISIASVTGDIVINAEAIEDVGWISGEPYEIEWTSGYKIDNSTGLDVESSTHSVSDYLPCSGASAVEYSNVLVSSNRDVYYYDESKNYIYAFYKITSITPPDAIPRSARYMRVAKITTNTASVTPYLYPTLTESTIWTANQKYVLSYSADTSSGGTGSVTSDYAFCYGASTMQTNLYNRCFIYFFDAEKNQIGSAMRQNETNPITIPEGAYYFNVNPAQGSYKYDANTNNPWFYLY